jgi:hypothetical protein
MAAGWPPPPLQEQHRCALAKAGTKRVEGRTLSPDLLHPLREL